MQIDSFLISALNATKAMESAKATYRDDIARFRKVVNNLEAAKLCGRGRLPLVYQHGLGVNKHA